MLISSLTIAFIFALHQQFHLHISIFGRSIATFRLQIHTARYLRQTTTTTTCKYYSISVQKAMGFFSSPYCKFIFCELENYIELYLSSIFSKLHCFMQSKYKYEYKIQILYVGIFISYIYIYQILKLLL